MASPKTLSRVSSPGMETLAGSEEHGIFSQIPESLVYPAQPGQQYVTIKATWAPTSASSFMEKLVLVAPHAGYIFIQTDKTIYTPEHSGIASGHLA